MSAFWHDYSPQQVIGGQNRGRLAVNRRFPSGIIHFADDQRGSFIRDGLNRKAVRFVIDDARLSRSFKVSLRQVEPRFVNEIRRRVRRGIRRDFKQCDLVWVEWMLALTANPESS